MVQILNVYSFLQFTLNHITAHHTVITIMTTMTATTHIHTHTIRCGEQWANHYWESTFGPNHSHRYKFNTVSKYRQQSKRFRDSTKYHANWFLLGFWAYTYQEFNDVHNLMFINEFIFCFFCTVIINNCFTSKTGSRKWHKLSSKQYIYNNWPLRRSKDLIQI